MELDTFTTGHYWALRRDPHSKTGGWGFESLHSCQL